LIASDGREVLEQACADTVTLHGIRYRERHFGALHQLWISVKSRKRDDPPSGLGNDRRRRAALATGQCPYTRSGEGRQTHEAEVQTFLRKGTEEFEQRLDVILSGQPEAYRGSVSQDNVSGGNFIGHLQPRQVLGGKTIVQAYRIAPAVPKCGHVFRRFSAGIR
jgi:hypothetical protein